MSLTPDALQILVGELSKLPGVGEKTALRYAVSLLKGGSKRVGDLERALFDLRSQVGSCPCCHFWTQDDSCKVCSDLQRERHKLCVVRDAPDVLALERQRKQPWKYHVLQGLLSPMAGIGPTKIRLETLFSRIETESIDEIILAIDATLEGDATAFYIRDHLSKHYPHVLLSRTALGIPAGSAVEYLDPSTLEHALSHRIRFE